MAIRAILSELQNSWELRIQESEKGDWVTVATIVSKRKPRFDLNGKIPVIDFPECSASVTCKKVYLGDREQEVD